jgi:phosphoglycerate dehydrogenase-like enzyme
MISAAFFGNEALIAQIYGAGRREQIAARTDLRPHVLSAESLCHSSPQHGLEVLFSTWGMPCLTDEQLEQLPDLRAVFYAAGSVQSFARPLLAHGITVASAWRANAVPVAEFALAQILLSCKGYFQNQRASRGGGGAFHGPGNYGETIALLGAGAIGGVLVGLLRPFHLKPIVYDPFLSEDAALELGVERVTLEDAFGRGFVVSNHLADKPETAGIINGALLSRLRPYATFLNTGRGRTVRHDDLAEVFRARPDLMALLDVTDPEPLPARSPLWMLPNVQITSHIAGSIHDEVSRMADYMIADFDRYASGQPLHHAVTAAQLNSMA